MSDEIKNTLVERGKRYGSFDKHADITQSLKAAMNGSSIRMDEDQSMVDKWKSLSSDKKEALEMIMHKVGRILNGDPEYRDSWVDIAGYAQLVADRMKEDKP